MKDNFQEPCTAESTPRRAESTPRRAMRALMVLVVAMTLVAITSGCKSVRSPIEAFHKSSIAGDGYKNALNQMESIARNAVIVYDPDITDEEFDVWMARHDATTRRFQALLELYGALAPPSQSQRTSELESIMDQRSKELSVIKSKRE